MKLAIVSLGGTSSELIAKEAKNYFEEVELVDIRKIEVHAESKELKVLYEKKAFPEYDCVYVRGSFNYALIQRTLTQALMDKNVYLPLQPESFTLAHDKFLTMLALQKVGVKIPTTYLAATMKAAKKILEEIHFPVIMKILSGTQGKGVMSAESLSSAKSMLDALESLKQPILIQEYIETEATDIRAIVAGDKVIASMKRIGRGGDIRANIHQGGKGIPYELDSDAEESAIKAAKAVGADICAVDILESVKGARVLEVNLSPGLKGIMEALRENVPKMVAEFLFKETESFKKIGKEKRLKEIEKKIKDRKEKEVLSNIEMKMGKIKLPKLMTKISGFKEGEEVVIAADEGKIEVRRMDL